MRNLLKSNISWANKNRWQVHKSYKTKEWKEKKSQLFNVTSEIRHLTIFFRSYLFRFGGPHLTGIVFTVVWCTWDEFSSFDKLIPLANEGYSPNREKTTNICWKIFSYRIVYLNHLYSEQSVHFFVNFYFLLKYFPVDFHVHYVPQLPMVHF